MTTGETIALCSLGVAVIGFGWKLIQDWHDKAILEVAASFNVGLPHLDGEPIGEAKPCFAVAITNTGRRAVTVNGVGGKWRQARAEGDSFTFLSANNLPKLLSPGESHTEIYWNPKQLGLLDDVEQIWVRDATGKLWYADEKKFEDLRVWGGVMRRREGSTQA